MSNQSVTGRELVLDLVNRQNLLSLPLDLVNANVLGRVYAPLNPTQVSTNVIGLPTGEYEGNVLVNINRIDLTERFAEIKPRLVGTGATTLYDMLDWIGNELGMSFNVEDFLQTNFVWLSEREQVNIILESKVDSLVYCGKFVIHFTRRRETLNEALIDYSGDSLHFPNLTHESFLLGKTSVTPKTWAFDFTEHRSSIAKHIHYNILGNPNGCRSLMQNLFGYANWPYGWDNVTNDFPTSAVPEANKDFERVVIQKLYDNTPKKTRPYEGIAYFHYNEI